MSEPSKTPKLDDVAALVGVSTATVSRFFNNPDVVKPATADRIREAISKTGYIPNMLAGGLASNRTRDVAVMIPHLNNSIFNETIEAMVAELSAAGHNVMIGLTDLDPSRRDEIILQALGRRADAIIATGAIEGPMRDALQRSGTPVIEIWDLPEDPVDLAVGFSHHAVGVDIARFLKTRGYTRPHVITATGARAHMRRDALVEEWLELGGLPPTEDTVDIPSRFGHARAAFANIRRLDEMPDVVVCGSDWLAQGLIVEAIASGFKVPDDIAVVGFGNSSVADEMRPTITTIDIDGRRIAREAIALLRRRSDGEKIAQRSVDVGFRLIARGSA